MKKAQDRWTGAHVRLKRLFDERAVMTQAEFGLKFDIGTQGMVWQYLSGHRPLNYEAAAKFARGLGCTIYDICPEMAESIKDEILPVLGKALRRAAMVLIALAAQQFAPSDGEGAVLHNSYVARLSAQVVELNTHCMTLISRIVKFARDCFTGLHIFRTA